MSDSEAPSHNIPKPKETVHQAKTRQQQELKALSKSVKGKALKEKEKEVTAKHTTELDELTKAWSLFKLAEAGELPSSTTTETTTNSTSSAIPASETPVDLDSDMAMYAQHSVGLSKAAKKRLAREKKENEEFEEALDRQSKCPNLGLIESTAIANRLSPLVFGGQFQGTTGGKVFTISADGHCLFKALSHQLSLYLPFEGPNEAQKCECPHVPSYSDLRMACRDEILANVDDYLPFLCDENGDLMDHDGVKAYAEKISNCGSMPLWGSHTEISIISKLFQRPITIISSDFTMTVGGDDATRTKPGLFVSFHKDLFSSGEHYNSVVPHTMVTSRFD